MLPFVSDGEMKRLIYLKSTVCGVQTQKSIPSERHGCHGALHGAETYAFRALILLLGIPNILPGLDLFAHVSPTCSRPQTMEVCTCAGGFCSTLRSTRGCSHVDLEEKIASPGCSLRRKPCRLLKNKRNVCLFMGLFRSDPSAPS